MTYALRKDIPPPPPKCSDLPIEERGYPVPWFVEWVDGKPDFRVASSSKVGLAWNDRRCWICGSKLGVYRSFVAGPMCGINRTSSEPPSHLECAVWAAKACPFLTRPKAVRREAGLPEAAQGGKPLGGVSIPRNPGVALVWTSRNPRPFRDGMGGTLFNMGDPTDVRWYALGRAATLGEVEESIATGLPSLMEIAASDPRPGGVEALMAAVEAFKPFLPAEVP